MRGSRVAGEMLLGEKVGCGRLGCKAAQEEGADGG